MKFIRPIFEFVEIYPFKEGGKIDGTYYYFFSDGQNEFRVEIDRRPEGEAEILYRVKTGNDWTFDIVQTNIYRILKTIFGSIIPDFIEKNNWCEMITIKGLGKETEKESTSKRTPSLPRWYWFLSKVRNRS